jgi:hypothetical protein
VKFRSDMLPRRFCIETALRTMMDNGEGSLLLGVCIWI